METSSASSTPASRAFQVPSRATDNQKAQILIEIENFDFYYGAKQALFDINLKLDDKRVTAFIGPSGCGKSTLLRCLNRMNDLIDGTSIQRGGIKIRDIDVNARDVDPVELRKRVGMVFQKSNPFPQSIYEDRV